ncbi:hypothetical protein HYQ46_013354 [Verticillium longisporum]|nr:hypothetical protein HYQ46_013354 [Verticillium longisporum]
MDVRPVLNIHDAQNQLITVSVSVARSVLPVLAAAAAITTIVGTAVKI